MQHFMTTATSRSLESLGDGLGPRLRQERKRLGLTQAQLATAVGISAPTQVGYEQGNRAPDVHYVTAVERIGVDERYIRTGVRASRAAVAALDWDFFLDVQRAGDAWFLRELGIALGQKESNKIARLLYEMLIDEHEVEDRKVERVLRLVVSNK